MAAAAPIISLRRAQDVSEDDQLEVNPFVFVDEETDLKQPSDLEVLRTPYSRHFFNHVITNHFYMGHRHHMISNFTLLPGRRYKSLVRYPAVQSVEQVGHVLQERLSVQSFEPQQLVRPDEPKLLDMSKYIMSRIHDIAESIALDRDDKADKSIHSIESIQNPDERKAVEENIETFLYNNTWTFYSDDKTEEVTLLCPIFSMLVDDATGETVYMMKFLRLNRLTNTIYPYIYMVPIREIRNSLLEIRVKTDGLGELTKELVIYMKIGNLLNNFFDSYSFYNPDSSELKVIDFPSSNPQDCVVVSMFMCGLLPQPDMTRFHNLFRSIEKVYDPATNTGNLKNTLSFGYQGFVKELIGRRVINFYNREDINRPLKTVSTLRIYLPLPTTYIQPAGPRYYVAANSRGYDLFKVRRPHPLDGEMYDIAGGVAGNSYAQNLSYINKLLDDFGCREPNTFFPVCIRGHQLLIYHDGKKYILYDPQVHKKYNLLDVNHPNYRNRKGQIDPDLAFIDFFVINTTRESQREIRVPEMLTLFEYNRQTHSYAGDMYPIVRQYINRYIVDMKAGRAQEIDYSERVPYSYSEFVESPLNQAQLNIVNLSYNKLNYEEITEYMQRTIHNKLLLLRQPTPSISFKKVVDVEDVLNRAIQNLNSLSTLREIRNFSVDFLNRNYAQIRQRIASQVGWFYGNYNVAELYDFLYSRPMFASFLKEYLEIQSPLKVAEIREDSINHICRYLGSQRKPILGVNRIFRKVLKLAEKDGVELLIVRYFNILKSRNLSSLVQIADVIAAELNPEIGMLSKPSEDQIAIRIYDTLHNLVDRVKQRKLRLLDEAKIEAMYWVSKKYVLFNLNPPTVAELEAFIQEQQNRQIEEYKQEYLADNQARARMGLPLENPDQDVIDDIMQPLTVKPALIKQTISKLKEQFKNHLKDANQPIDEQKERVEQLKKLKGLKALDPEDEKRILILRYIESYFEDRINKVYIDIHADYYTKKLADWDEYMRQVAIDIFNKNRKQFVAEADKISALEVFTYIMNIVKTTHIGGSRALEDHYLGRR